MRNSALAAELCTGKMIPSHVFARSTPAQFKDAENERTQTASEWNEEDAFPIAMPAMWTLECY